LHPIEKEATSSLSQAKPEALLQRSEKMGRRKQTQTPRLPISPETKQALLEKLKKNMSDKKIKELESTFNQFKISTQ
jgi:hypothetical protein